VTDDLCKHELMLGTCVDCRPRPPAGATIARPRPVTFEARYPGRCAACTERFDVGDDMMRDDGELIHPECFE
jgi:hypothetical protein